jgi:hypothetical protein
MSRLEQLALAVESSADWRASKAKQYPEDRRNANSSRSLTKLAKNLRGLPCGNEHVVAYEEIMERAIELELDRISETETKYISRYGFDYPMDGEPTAFLQELTESVRHLVDTEEQRIAEEEDEAKYEAAKEAADEEAKEAAHEAAKEAADEAAKEAAEEAAAGLFYFMRSARRARRQRPTFDRADAPGCVPPPCGCG